jgi:DeoR/GlpR family transcriptional regulator of sugar metabolism
MALNERQKKILKIIQEEKKVFVFDLARDCGVTEASIRLDLKLLSSLGCIKRFHGGARSLKVSAYEERVRINQQMKKAVAKKAVDYINAGDTLFLDSGTTLLMLARMLTGIEDLTIITNSIPIANQIGREYGKNIILIGGSFNYSEQCCEGPMTEMLLDKLYASKAFIGADSIDAEKGLFSNGISMFGYVQKIIHNSKQTVLLVDSTKFSKVGTLKIGEIDCVDMIITDRGVPEKDQDIIRKIGIDIVVV